MTNILNKFKKNIFLLFLICIFFSIIYKSKLVLSSTNLCLQLFTNNLFPSVFIFYTLSDLLVNYDILKIFKSSIFISISNFLKISTNSLYIIFFSMLTGFPSGSKYISDFYEKKLISLNEASYLLMFTHFSNPLFILGFISSIYSSGLSIIILLSTYISNYIILLVFRPNRKEKISTSFINIDKYDFITCLNMSFKKTINILIIILFNSIIFSVLSELLCIFFNNTYFKSFIFILFDITKGISNLSGTCFSLFFKGLMISTFLSFGGISIHVQVKSILNKQKLPYSYFLHGRIISVSITAILYIVLFYLFKGIHY